MNYYLFLTRSITHAQELSKALERAGVYVRIRRASPSLAERGCGYSLEVAENRYGRARRALLDSGRFPTKIFFVSNGERQEVSL